MTHTFLVFLISLLPFVSPVEWKAAVEPVSGNEYELVLTASIEPGYYIHPMADRYAGTSLELAPGVTAQGAPTEEFEAADYKGETVAEKEYVIRQKLVLDGASKVEGNVTWYACTNGACSSPEDYGFSIPVTVSEPVASAPGNLWKLILEAILWGFLMLLTPCVFPMVPMTVSFFLKQKGGRLQAILYGAFIVLLYTLPICVIIGLTWAAGGATVTADIFNWLSTHWLPNILFFVIFMLFAASFFGAFEIVLPSSWTTRADAKSGKGGILGVFFLALTLVLVSFSCTGPIVGTVLIKSTQGEFWVPMVTMLAFSIAFALPFALLALFPSLLSRLPKSGGWLNSVKVVLGFIEIALGLKFLSTADQTYHWHILDREVYLAIWIAVFILLALYLLGLIRFRNDEPLKHLSFGRFTLALADIAFVVYLIPGMWGAPLKALSGYLPPIQTQDFVLSAYQPAGALSSAGALQSAGALSSAGALQSAGALSSAGALQGAGALQEAAPALVEPVMPGGHLVALPHGLVGFASLEDGLAAASASGKRVFVDITGHGCVNCREMEARVWSDPAVLSQLREDYVIVSLYVDDKTRLPESEWVTTPAGKVLKDVGRVNSFFVQERFGVNSQPNYFILDASGAVLRGPRGYNLDAAAFAEFLRY